MERVNKIINHPRYREYLDQIKKCEIERIFCKHDMVHFLDVCRIAENLWLQHRLKGQEYNPKGTETFFHKERYRELIYAAGLLHDIGRWQEYESGIRHEIASAKLAPEILEQCGFDREETKEIIMAIENHRNRNVKEQVDLSGLLYRADKASRACFACEAQLLCDWSKEKKNLVLR